MRTATQIRSNKPVGAEVLWELEAASLQYPRCKSAYPRGEGMEGVPLPFDAAPNL